MELDAARTETQQTAIPQNFDEVYVSRARCPTGYRLSAAVETHQARMSMQKKFGGRTMSEERNEEIISIHIVGTSESGVHITSIKLDAEYWSPEFNAWADWHLRKNGFIYVGWVICRRENGRLQPHHAFVRTPQTVADDNAMTNAILRICVSGTGFIDERDGAEVAIEGTKILASLFPEAEERSE